MVHKIRELAHLKGISSFAELEHKAGVCERSIYKWDKHEPNVYSVYRVAKVLGTTVEDLLKG